MKKFDFDLNYNEKTMEVTLNGKVVAKWNDEANQDYPEDLIWHREISGLFREAVRAGYELAKSEASPQVENRSERCRGSMSAKPSACGCGDCG